MSTAVELLRVGAFAGFLAFIPWYWLRTGGTWRRHLEGWWLMSVCFVVFEFLCLAVAVQWFGPGYWGREFFQIVVYAQLCGLPVALIALLERAQRRGSRRGQLTRTISGGPPDKP